jgi:predicted HNH restriction endonuclease
MKKGDVIYVKEGPLIVGRGTVNGPYKFRMNRHIVDGDGYLWPHQIPVAWERDFPSFRLLLGGEPNTVRTLTDEHLAQIETALRSAFAREDSNSAREGELVSRMNRFRKRNRAIIEAKRRASRGICEACGMSLRDIYRLEDKLNGRDCLHVHHRNPLAESEGARVTTLDDLVLLCPNCHAVVHAFDPPLTLEQLRGMIR